MKQKQRQRKHNKKQRPYRIEGNGWRLAVNKEERNNKENTTQR